MASETPRRRHSLFKPCIDLHDGVVKQIVGGTLSDQAPAELKTNFVASQSSKEFALLYKKNSLEGGHVIKLGPGNDGAAKDALSAWPGGLQVGGGITEDNALEWIEVGASKVIVTSYLFPGARFSSERLQKLATKVGPERLVVDVSCRRVNDKWVVAMNKWQTLTDMENLLISYQSTAGDALLICTLAVGELIQLNIFSSEFLIHAADVEGLCKGIDEELVRRLGEWVKIPTTYAGGAKDISDLDLVDRLSGGKVDLTYGSALDIFGGSLVKFEELVKCNNEAKANAGII